MQKTISFVILLLCCIDADAQTGFTNNGNLRIHTGGTVSGFGSFINTASASLTNNGNFYVRGNLGNDQASMAVGTGTLYLNGTNAQAVNGSQPFRTYNFVSDNTSGITLNNDLQVSGAHTFTSGIISSSATPNYLVYEAGSSYSGSGDARHVNGWVKKIGATNFTFPVGNGTYERSVILSGLSASSEFNVQYQPTTPNTNLMQLPLRTVDQYEYWNINRVSGGSASVTMNWDRSKIYFPNWILADIRAAGWDGTSLWINNGGAATGNVATTGTITSNSVSTFNQFTFGSISWVLPLKLVDFTAKRQDDYTQINWTTASEQNVSHFIVERSDDGRTFYSIGQVNARNTNNSEQYSSRDNKDIQQIAYYRLQCIDKDGNRTVSSIVPVTSEKASNLVLLTNPVQDRVKLLATPQLNGIFQYQLHSINGQMVQQGTLNIHNDRQYEIPLQSLRAGTYTLRVNNNNHRFEYKLVVL